MKKLLEFSMIILFVIIPFNLNSQVRLDLKNKVLTVDKNAARNKAKEAANKPKQEPQNTKPANETKRAETPAPEAEEKPVAEAETSLKAFSKYDFVPGDQVILYEDFSQDAVGDFPALWTTDASGEVNSLNIAPGNWFNLNSTEGTYWFMKNIDFPVNFILEMDIVPKKAGGRIAADIVFFGEEKYSEMNKEHDPGNSGLHIAMEKEEWRTRGYKDGNNELIEAQSGINTVEAEKVNHVIIWVQNRRVRIYNKGGKVLDVPTNIYEGSKFNRVCFKLYRGASCGSYISNIKITNAAPDMRSKLLTEGKLVTYGINFDVNKDVIRPESYGTIKGIADILKENPDLKIKILGHTDSDGADAVNLDLSKRRSVSVKNELVSGFGIDASRIEADGLGESQPIAANDTPGNKALNRRVEFLKL